MQFYLKQNQRAIIFLLLVTALNVFITSSYCSFNNPNSSQYISFDPKPTGANADDQDEVLVRDANVSEPIPSIVRSDVEVCY